jgi:hypothetical protein
VDGNLHVSFTLEPGVNLNHALVNVGKSIRLLAA